MLIIASVPVFVLVETVVVFAVLRFRMRPGQEMEDGPPIHGNTRLEVVWTIAPALLIIALVTYAYTVLRSNEASKPNEMTINVTERQLRIEFSYPQSSGDMVMSWSSICPSTGRSYSRSALSTSSTVSSCPTSPRRSTPFRASPRRCGSPPTRMGSYPAECTELCGAGHGLMRAAVRVVSDAQFNTWMAAQKPNSAPPLGAPPPNGAGAGSRLTAWRVWRRGLVGLGHQPRPGGLDRRQSAAERLVSA